LLSIYSFFLQIFFILKSAFLHFFITFYFSFF